MILHECSAKEVARVLWRSTKDGLGEVVHDVNVLDGFVAVAKPIRFSRSPA